MYSWEEGQGSDRWLAIRQARRKVLSQALNDYEDGTEFNEGTAKYVEFRFIQELEKRKPSPDIWFVQGFEPISRTPGSVRGLDDKRIQTTTARAKQVRLGTATYPEIEFAIADLPVFERYMGVQGNVGLLGNSFLQAFTRVEIDFDHRTLRLSK